MSDDLISRKALMSHIESEKEQWGEDYDTEQILGDIEDFQATYSLDKSIEKMETYISQQSKNEMLSDSGKWIVKRVVEECIKIVRSGGVENG